MAIQTQPEDDVTNPYTADQVVAEKPDALWPVANPGQHGGSLDGRIFRKTQHFVAGHRDKGKGLVTIRMGADVIKAGGSVLHMQFEDDPGLMTRPRYEAAGIRGDLLKRLHLRKFRFPERVSEFEEYVAEHKIDMIILDPVASSLSGNVNRHSDSIRQVLDRMQSFIADTPTRPAVIWVEHPNKNVKKSSGDPLAAIGGTSSGLVAYARVGYILGIDPDTDGDRILAHVKGNFMDRPPALRFELDVVDVPVKVVQMDEDTGQPSVVDEEIPAPALLFSEECIFDPMRLLVADKDDAKLGRPDDKKQAAAEWLTNYLFGAFQGGLTATADFPEVKIGEGVLGKRVQEDAKQVGIPERTLRRAKSDLGVDVLPKGGRQAKWHLPQEIVQALSGGDEEVAEEAPAEPQSVGEGQAEGKRQLKNIEGEDVDDADAFLAAILADDEDGE